MTDKQNGSVWKHSLWILWTFTFVLNWVAFLYIGSKAKRPAWWLAGAVYATPVVLLLVLQDSARLLDALAVLVLGLASIVHAFLARPKYLAHVNAELEQKLRKYQALQELIQQDQEAAPATRVQPKPPAADVPAAEIPVVLATEPDLPPELPPAVAPPDTMAEEPAPVLPPRTLTQRVDEFVLEDVEDNGQRGLQAQVPNHQIINLNTASAGEIGGVPGLGQMLGMRAVSIRETQGHFTSIEQFVDAIGLRPHVANRIRPYVTL
ncbi:ComEA family DNA-binding protein [Tumebacillus permanentifrigoris]|uniref:Helix-hairpin-helix protein n=1 Tax=Tumebacillus permanentifrigoris TaxID=378543 RepID=A0A316DID4_9BACL|nr:helix-hairpin-helix domain-containing protein [Tumebacillus permanentifrigoris]PWK16393.1 helix-hairpin-helix protein [Tumebacillus permanentifrigoris]